MSGISEGLKIEYNCDYGREDAREELDDALIKLVKKHGYKMVGLGYDHDRKLRELAFVSK